MACFIRNIKDIIIFWIFKVQFYKPLWTVHERNWAVWATFYRNWNSSYKNVFSIITSKKIINKIKNPGSENNQSQVIKPDSNYPMAKIAAVSLRNNVQYELLRLLATTFRSFYV